MFGEFLEESEILKTLFKVSERLKNIYNLFNQSDYELSKRIDRLVVILSKEIPDYAANRLRKLKREKLTDNLLIETLENLVDISNIEEFQKRLIQSEKMIIRTICSESFQ